MTTELAAWVFHLMEWLAAQAHGIASSRSGTDSPLNTEDNIKIDSGKQP